MNILRVLYTLQTKFIRRIKYTYNLVKYSEYLKMFRLILV